MKINPYAIPGLMDNDEIAAKIWGIPVTLLYIHTRKREAVECRQVLLDHLRKTTKLSLTKIGARYNVDRNTVQHACMTVANLIETNNEEFLSKYSLFQKHIITNIVEIV